jgi:protein-S-isoprenylcysteine O-methyltransferase Ste14
MKGFALLVFFLGVFLLPATMAFRRAKSELALHERISTATFGAALFAYTALGAGVILSSWLNAWPLLIVGWLRQTSGMALLVLGAIVYVTARLQLRSFRQTWALRTNKLLTSGIYRVLRHPQNLGWGFLLAGVALLGRSGVALALTGVYVLTCLIWLPFEEAFLERRFGSSYARYRNATPALVRLCKRRRKS